MTLLELYEACGRLGSLQCDSNVMVQGVSRHTAQVQEGDIFFCREGAKHDSHEAAQNLLNQGASVVVGHQDLQLNGNYWRVDKGDEAHIAAAFYGHPSRRLKVLGVTGTDGKSTTAWIIVQLLNELGYKAACLGTLGVWKGRGWQDWGFTTPEPEVLQRTFKELMTEGFTHVVMEVSSHALSSARVRGTRFEAVALTNLGHDHLDDYESLEAYHNAKLELFKIQSMPLKQVRPISRSGEAYWVAGRNVKVSLESAERHCQHVTLKVEAQESLTDFPFGGEHNLRNLETAVGLTQCLGLNLNDIANAVKELKPLVGRWQWVDNTDHSVMVDYAHTPGALKTILTNLRPLVSGDLKVLFGCGGDRDPHKRQMMGREAKALADQVYVTDDNPRDEDPSEIRSEILKGLNGHGVDIADRAEAIQQAIASLKDNDVLVIAGKGHETGQLVKGQVIAFDDVQVARAAWENRSC